MKTLFALSFPVLLAISATAATPGVAHKSTNRPADYGKIPLGFEANQGQTDASVEFLAHGEGYTVYLRQGEALLALSPAASGENGRAPGRNPEPGRTRQAGYLQIDLVGANRRARGGAEEEQITKTNYLVGNDPARWHTEIPNYARVRYQSIYRGIDLVYYGRQRELEHDFIVAPHADPAQIVLALGGKDALARMQIDAATGDLVVAKEDGSELRLLKPVTYQESGGRRVAIDSGYKVLPHQRVSFEVGSYDHERPLVIDPILTYSTYIGGGGGLYGGDEGNGIALDAAGDAYIVGKANSSDFPVTTGAFQTQSKAGYYSWTAFVSKLNATGTALVYSTYLGGTAGDDEGYGIAVDASGNAYVTGTTFASDFPVTCNAFQTTNPEPSGRTGFVSELNASGSALIYSTYLGGTSGSYGDYFQAIAVNSTGNAYVTGMTYATDFPTTDGSFEPDFPNSAYGTSAFVTELSADGSSLVYSTYLGGNSNIGSSGNSIVLDSSGDAFVVGTTGSSNFPVTSGAYQTTLKGSSSVFVTEFNPSGAKEIFSTLLGGSRYDYGSAVALDSKGNVYAAGASTSGDFPLTPGAVEGADVASNGYFQGTAGAGFVTKLSADGSSLVYSTLVEGGNTSISGLAVDAQGYAYVVGTTSTYEYSAFGGFISSPSAIPTPADNTQANAPFLVKLDPNGASFSYATVFGGGRSDSANAVVLDKSGNPYMTGSAVSSNFPTTSGAFQTVGSGDAFVSAFALSGVVEATTYPNPITPIVTSLSGSGSEGNLSCDPNDPSEDSLSFGVSLDLAAASSGPAATGTLTFTDGVNYYYPLPDVVTVYDMGVYNFTDGFPDDAPWGTTMTINWTASYSGDANYQPSNTSGSFTINLCAPPSGDAAAHAMQLPKKHLSPKIQLQLKPVSTTGEMTHNVMKFYTPAPASSPVRPQTDPACYAPALTATPVFSVPGGTYTSTQTVALSDTTKGATIYYTTNGTTPTTASTPYTGPITVSSDETIEAMAAATDNGNSAVATAKYTITLPTTTPTFSPAGGTYITAQSVTISDSTGTATIYYTTDKSTPTTASTKYTGAIAVSSSETIQAIAMAADYSVSPVATAVYTITPPAATPVFSPAGGTYITAQSVTISDATGTATIYYTTDKSTPTTASMKYTGAIAVSSSETINAIATAADYSVSAVATAVYTITPPAATPVFSPAAGTYTSIQSVTIADATNGAAIYYTTDGSTPTTTSTKYAGPITVGATETIRAIGIASGYSSSAVAVAAYTIPPMFTISAPVTSLTVEPGESATMVISVTPEFGFNAPTTFSCTGLPAGATCSFLPATVTPSAGTQTQVTLTVSASSSARLLPERSRPLLPPASLAVALSCLFWRRRRRFSKLWVIAVLSLSAGLLSGCGGSSKPAPVSTKVSVVATSGSIQQTLPISITIE